ncbi:2-oxo acid dehydrogenase subunit E2 [Acidilutibacter cellobiosedens]|jgi:pyruvate dehydrogenase E2 component (dihydrolipoamide acetyltransferase)|uniref:Dihydrolipoamide acetyltransferase component of pyruvate dehydrogenase complex n=1 Tax=Acidilutibacter cellobiosedens TaxID=2507161 RepID=A0A410Q8R9_9FIRM|nr:dihydrolipoamide acetyltransferase family protein [Acidilutibacter cellobiosedens]QAT60385.1 2-oxo acid dehydrogenase subunit E2 [Acidilutibacter cellobiosedens]
MAELVLMPKMGLTMTEGFLTNWKKSEGDIVTKGDTLFEVETDKLTNEYKSTVSGVLRKIIIKEGTVKVLEPVAIIAETGEDISGLLKKLGENTQPDTPNLKPKTVSKESGKSVVSNRERVKISPRAKKIAKELNVDISLVKGTGPENSITEDDIRNYSENKKSTNKKVSPTATVVAEQLNVDIDKIQKDTRIMKDDVIKFKLSEELAKYADPKESRKPMNTMRKVIGKRMLESVQTSPTVNYNIKVDTSALKHIREELKATLKVSYTDILVKIVSKTLLKFPLLNSSIDGNEIIIRNYVNMGVAVALHEGLLVPVIKYANVKGLKEISGELKELAEKAKNNELTPDELSGGTFTISNLGMFGIELFTPIINQPEVAILGVNTINEEAKVINGQLVIKPIMNLSLTADHRVIDGAAAAAFMAKLKEYIEKPGLLLI